MCEVQAAEIRFGDGIFWGVQYHPEYRLHDIAAVIRRYGQTLVDEGFFADPGALAQYAADLSALDADGRRGDVAWKLVLNREILNDDCRQTELKNWIASLERT
jgi:GMP synthase (glutamine-hydrolysing)